MTPYKTPFVLRHIGKAIVVLAVLMVVMFVTMIYVVEQVGLKNIVQHIWEGEGAK